jgi:hypothetical protein
MEYSLHAPTSEPQWRGNFSHRSTRTPYHCSLHSINIFWDTYRQYTPTRLFFFSKPNQSLQSSEPTCVLRVQKELDRGAESHIQLQIFPFLCANLVFAYIFLSHEQYQRIPHSNFLSSYDSVLNTALLWILLGKIILSGPILSSWTLSITFFMITSARPQERGVLTDYVVFGLHILVCFDKGVQLSALVYIWATLFLEDINAGTWLSRLGESQELGQ